MTAHLPRSIEICVENTDGLIAAQNAGADRAELCASLLEGGLTPSAGMVREALRVATIPFFVMVRPRGGDFLYSEVEFASMLEDVKAFREMGVQGVVAGCLNPDGTIDEVRMKALVDAARPMKVTCHRAFDMTRDHVEAVEALVRAGVDRVLTSGRHDTAMEGLTVLAETVKAANGRIVIMGCGALDAGNIGEVLDRTKVDEVHFASLRHEPSGMRFRNPAIGMGGTDLEREYTNTVTSEDGVRATIAAARNR
jgi:copper homeostasis protein